MATEPLKWGSSKLRYRKDTRDFKGLVEKTRNVNYLRDVSYCLDRKMILFGRYRDT